MASKPVLSKSQRRHLRELRGAAHERALTAALRQFDERFEVWKADELTAYELNDEIHRHHQVVSREIYKMYAMGDVVLSVARAIAEGIVNLNEVREDCRAIVEHEAATMKRIYGKTSDA